jgi:hypothetical protein
MRANNCGSCDNGCFKNNDAHVYRTRPGTGNSPKPEAVNTACLECKRFSNFTPRVCTCIQVETRDLC